MCDSRRCFLALGAGFLATTALPSDVWAKSLRRFATRAIDFRNLHTEERASVTYHDGSRYLRDGLGKANRILRDWRANEVARIDPRVLDFVQALTSELDYDGEVGIISGYRSPNTNSMLRKRGGGVARRSLHMRGMAIDIRLEDLPAKRVAKAARKLRLGGVGLYSRSNFVHLDSGPVRTWGA